MKVACYDPKNKEMFGRYKRCISTLHQVLEEKLFTRPEICMECFNIDFICLPRFDTLEEVYAYDHVIKQKKATIKLFGEFLFKIPIHVNNIESYVRMLLYEHYKY